MPSCCGRWTLRVESEDCRNKICVRGAHHENNSWLEEQLSPRHLWRYSEELLSLLHLCSDLRMNSYRSLISGDFRKSSSYHYFICGQRRWSSTGHLLHRVSSPGRTRLYTISMEMRVLGIQKLQSSQNCLRSKLSSGRDHTPGWGVPETLTQRQYGEVFVSKNTDSMERSLLKQGQ